MPTFKDHWYKFGLANRFKKHGEQNLKKIAKLYNTKETWEQRASVIRKGILSAAGLDPFPKKTPLNPIIHSRKTHKGYTVDNIILQTIPGFFLGGNLYCPADFESNSKQSTAVVLLPHGHFTNGRCEPDMQHMAAGMARMGAVAMIYDMVGYNDTKQVEHNIRHAFTFQLWNSTRVLDFLLSMPAVDPKRVGISGPSGGGTQTFMLTAVDPRITASAPAVMVSSFFFGGCICESGLPIHKGEGYKTNNAEIAAMAAPRPQHIISLSTDWSRFVPTLEYPFIQRTYGLYHSESSVGYTNVVGEKHNYGPSKRAPICAFFAQQFGLPLKNILCPSGELDDLDKNLEEYITLKAIDAAHPLPANALKGESQVLAALKEIQ